MGNIEKISIVHFGQKNCMSREGSVEIVVGELSKRQVNLGNEVTCINRTSAKYNKKFNNEYWDGVKIKYASTINKKGSRRSYIIIFCKHYLSTWQIRYSTYP